MPQALNTKFEIRVIKKFAWWPFRTSTGKLVWLRPYYDCQGCMVTLVMGRDPIETAETIATYSEKEYFLIKLSGNA